MRKWVVLAVLTFGPMAIARAAPTTDPRELEAREDFATGKYQRALELFARLYAETLHPTYLRNIGRCYQYLGDPDRALISFRDYLHKARNVDPAERREVEGYIEEMEALRQRQVEEARNTAPAPSTRMTAPAPVVREGPDTPAREPERRPASHLWLWLLGGVVLVGTAAALGASGVLTRTDRPACPIDRICP